MIDPIGGPRIFDNKNIDNYDGKYLIPEKIVLYEDSNQFLIYIDNTAKDKIPHIY